MKKLLLIAILLGSPAVQADEYCDDLYNQITGTKTQIDRVWEVLELKKFTYVTTSCRIFPFRCEERKKDYENYAIMYNALSQSYNQQVEIYQKNCK